MCAAEARCREAPEQTSEVKKLYRENDRGAFAVITKREVRVKSEARLRDIAIGVVKPFGELLARDWL